LTENKKKIKWSRTKIEKSLKFEGLINSIRDLIEEKDYNLESIWSKIKKIKRLVIKMGKSLKFSGPINLIIGVIEEKNWDWGQNWLKHLN